MTGGESKNIAYHGDVLNTTARILGLCKKFKRDIVFTDYYLKLIESPKVESELLATLKLRGKENESAIYGVR